ncbi:MAG: serine/threonine-protein kinase [Pirellulaceae bacterium]
MTDGDPKSQPAGETNKISQPPLDETLPPSWIRDQQQLQGGDDAEKLSTDDREGASPAASLSKPLTPDSVNDGHSDVLTDKSAEYESFTSQLDGELPQRFGDYELLEEIARGGMGVVFRARQVKLDRQVALKMILTGKLAGDSDVQRFYTEASSAAALDHPGVVPVYEVGEQNGQHFFSMGFIEGESLAAMIARNPLSPTRSANMLKKITEAMVYAHDEGVIHRDLKPANVLLDKRRDPHISDFGLAKKTTSGSQLTVTGQIIGTPSYMPPEQASGETNLIGPVADVYSLGAILYCCLTGRPPFQAANPMETLRQVVERDPVSPRQLNSQIDQDLDTICLKCLEKDPQRRYATAQDLVDELDRFLNGEPIKARPISALDRSFRWCRRNPVVTTLVAALTLTFIIGMAGITWKWREATFQRQQAEESQESEMNMATDEAEGISEIEEEQDMMEVQLAMERQDFRVAHSLLEAWTQTLLDKSGVASPDLSQQQTVQLETSLVYFKQFIERHAEEKKKLALVVESYSLAGRIQEVTGYPEEALGSHAQILQLLEKPVRSIPVPVRHAFLGQAYFESARLHGLLDREVQGSAQYSVEEKERQGQAHQQQIEYCLTQAFAQGFFKTQEYIERLEKDPCLLAFRSRKGFEKLLHEIEEANKRLRQ